MQGAGPFFVYAILALFTFFVTVPVVLNTISLFKVQKDFAGVMVEQGVVRQEDVDAIHPKKTGAGVVLSVITLFVTVSMAIKSFPMGLLCAGCALLAGLWKWRKILEFNSLTVQRFRNTYKDCMDEKKYNKYVKEHF